MDHTLAGDLVDDPSVRTGFIHIELFGSDRIPVEESLEENISLLPNGVFFAILLDREVVLAIILLTVIILCTALSTTGSAISGVTVHPIIGLMVAHLDALVCTGHIG